MTDFEELLQACAVAEIEAGVEFEVFRPHHVSMVTLKVYPSLAIALVKTRQIAKIIQQYYTGEFNIDFEYYINGELCYNVLFIRGGIAPLVTRFHMKQEVFLN